MRLKKIRCLRHLGLLSSTHGRVKEDIIQEVKSKFLLGCRDPITLSHSSPQFELLLLLLPFHHEAPNKPNQDSYSVLPQFGSRDNQSYFAVYDGHGGEGHSCSWFVRDNVSNVIFPRPLLFFLKKLHFLILIFPSDSCQDQF